ncbi:MAG: hypothetical protein FWD16_04910 [Clostridia bacterium]|nr:hypothetical protein [Clostridia bacterium]
MRSTLICIFLAILCALSLAACGGQTPMSLPPAGTTAAAGTAVTPTPVPQTDLGTRKNPAPMGQTLTFNGMAADYDNYIVELTAEKVIRGEDAQAMVMEGNSFNDAVGEGQEYILVLINAKVLESKNGERVSLSSIDFDFYSAAGVRYDAYVVVTGLEHSFPYVYPAAPGQPPTEIKGYAYQIVDVGDTPLMVFMDNSEDRLWFTVSADAVLPAPQTHPQSPIPG